LVIPKGELIQKRPSNPIPPGVQAEIDALAALPEDKINTGDIPEVRSWDDAKRGVFYAPLSSDAYWQEHKTHEEV
jgi:hypothetical protein